VLLARELLKLDEWAAAISPQEAKDPKTQA